MLRKIIPIVLVGILVLSGLGAVALPEEKSEFRSIESISFSTPKIVEKNEFINIELSESNSITTEVGMPLLPTVSKVFTFPFGTKIDSVNVEFSTQKEIKLDKPIEPSPKPQIVSMTYRTEAIENKDSSIEYSNIDIYPKQRFTYRPASGLKDGKNVVYLSVISYPVQYSPKTNNLYYSDSAKIDIRYNLPEKPIVFADTYDLLIIAPSEFSSELQRLVDHKNSINVKTKLTTLNEIPNTGKDEQESIKLYIKQAKEDWGITYLLLVGAGVEGKEKFPVRRAWIPSGSYEKNFPSDLYYADFYDSEGGFSDWDKDGDGKYAEYTGIQNDMSHVDILPDVYLGKLPCNNAIEVRNYVDKVIEYKAHNKMVNKILQIGGDTFPGDAERVSEGEFANDEVLKKLPGYSSTKLWASNGKLTKSNIASGFNSIVDFVDFSGHGSYSSWATHDTEDDDTWLPPQTLISPYTGFLYVDFDLFAVSNTKKLPVVVYNACSCSKYTEHETCISWKTLKISGGGIATFGASGIGYGSHGTHETEALFGWMEVHIFDEINKVKVLGDAWGNCITNYANSFDLDEAHYKTLLEMAMFGDPTLAIEDGDDPQSRDVDRPILQKFLKLIAVYFPNLERFILKFLK
jgi:hypothetical protein